MCLLEHLESLRRAFNNDRDHFPMADRIFKNAPMSDIVIHHQNWHTGKSRYAERFRRQFGYSPTNLHGKVESGTLSGFALDPESTAHQPHDLSGDRQTQPSPTVPACRGRICLRESIEDGLLFVHRDPDPSIPHAEL